MLFFHRPITVAYAARRRSRENDLVRVTRAAHGLRLRGALAVLGFLAAARAPVCAQEPAAPTPRSPAASAAAAPPDAGWPMATKDHANTRYTPLADITAGNVATLKLAFRFPTGVKHGHEAAPIVAEGLMFVVTPFPNRLYALDLARPGAPPKWSFDPKPQPRSQGVACCDGVNRGAAYDAGRVFITTLDAQVVAVEAQTGRELWRRRLGDVSRGETITMAPLVVKGKVLVGNSGGEMGVRGWIAALDAASGAELWRAYSTGPDREVLIGPSFKPYYASDQGQDLGEKTWPGETWKTGGGNVWGFLAYDPRLDLLYYGTANPGPWNPEQRRGANKWTSGVFARRPDTGEAVWFYQYSPHDLYDYDGVNENVLIDLPFQGGQRPVLVHPDRNGYVYVLDRASGQVLSADPFVSITTSSGVDLASGQLKYDPRTEPRVGQTVRNICPHSPGGKDWQPSAWSPRTGLLYIPHQNLCQDTYVYETSYIAGTPFVGAEVKMYAGPGGQRGRVTAWDPATRRPAWTIEEAFPVWSGTLATAGDVVFYGTLDGWFKAVDAKTGRPLWRYKTASGIVGQPMSYRGPDGRQYVAVLAGVGGWAGAGVTHQLDTRDPTAAKGFATALKDLPKPETLEGQLYVFQLP